MRRTRFMVIAAVALLAAAGMVMQPSHALAAGTTWTVLTTADTIPTVPCDTTLHTCVTLRDAILQSNLDTGDTIVLASATYTLTSCSGTEPSAGALEVEHSMTIQGQGSAKTIIASGPCPVIGDGPIPWDDSLLFTCGSPALTIDGVTLTGGDASNGGPSGSGTGGAINEGGGSICDPTQLSLTMTDVNVASNVAQNHGGGIYTFGANVSLTNVTFGNNTSKAGTAGAMFFAGANTLHMFDVYAHDNKESCDCEFSPALGGGAFRINDTSTTAGDATNLLIENNKANAFNGGGVLQEGAGTVNWNNVTFDGNSAPNDYGGAMYITAGTTANITNVTATANTARTWGGAFGVGVFVAPSTLNIRAGTINANTITGSVFGTGGGIFTDSGTVTLTQTILHDNRSSSGLNECNVHIGGTIASGGYNLADDTTCGLGQSTDTQNAAKDPLLASLATNSAGFGVPPVVGAGADSKALTTESLGAGSAALNVVPTSFCPPPSTDERGVIRPQGPACEIGAFEVGVVAPVIPVPPTGAAPAAPTGLLAVELLGFGAVLAALAVAGPPRRRRARP